MNDSMRILIATSSNYLAFHGQAIFTKNLAEGLIRHGHEVLVVASSERGPYSETEYHGVQIIALKSMSLKLINPNAVLAISTGRALRKIFTSFKPEIVHIQDHYPLCRSATHLALKSGVHIIGTNHFMPENLAAYIPLISRIKPFYNWVLWHWMREVYDRLEVVVGPSRAAVKMLINAGLKPPAIYISCGVDDNLFHPIPDVNRSAYRSNYGICSPCTVIFFVGRVDREKRLDVIIRSMTVLNREDIQFVIAGNGAEKRRLLALTSELGLEKMVHFSGFIPNSDLPSVLNSIDIFIMPGDAELLSIASLQAMACARPMLVADAVALPELVSENENGLLFRPGDVEDAAHCLAFLTDHPERWSDMGAVSLLKTKKHNLNHIVSEYEELYQSLVDGKPVPGQ
jgi:Glycosyltransferase